MKPYNLNFNDPFDLLVAYSFGAVLTIAPERKKQLGADMKRFGVDLKPVTDVGHVFESNHRDIDSSVPLPENASEPREGEPEDRRSEIRISRNAVAALFALGYWSFVTVHIRRHERALPHDAAAVKAGPTAERLFRHVMDNLNDSSLTHTWPADLPKPVFGEFKRRSVIPVARTGTELALTAAGWIMYHELSHIRNGHRGSSAQSMEQERIADAEARDYVLSNARNANQRWKRAIGIAVAGLSFYAAEERWPTGARRTHPPALERLVHSLDHHALGEDEDAYAIAALGVEEIAGVNPRSQSDESKAWREWLRDTCIEASRRA